MCVCVCVCVCVRVCVHVGMRWLAYPLMVDAMKTRYGPISRRTSGRGIAAASSTTTSSAWSSLCESDGWMYCSGRGRSSITSVYLSGSLQVGASDEGLNDCLCLIMVGVVEVVA